MIRRRPRSVCKISCVEEVVITAKLLLSAVLLSVRNVLWFRKGKTRRKRVGKDRGIRVESVGGNIASSRYEVGGGQGRGSNTDDRDSREKRGARARRRQIRIKGICRGGG